MTTLPRRSLFSTALALAFSLGHGAYAADYPNRPITMVVPAAAGGTTDIVARLAGQADQGARSAGDRGQ